MSWLKTIGWFFSLTLLASCDNASQLMSQLQTKPQPMPAAAADNAPGNRISLPALPIIQGAVMALAPTVNGQRNELMMRQVCALARGESTQDQVNQTLRQQGIDLSHIPHQGHPLSLLVDPDMSRRITACAAYVATSVMTLPRTSEFMVQTKADPGAKNQNTLSIDPQKLLRFLGVQLAVAKADADMFTLIATELEKTPGLTLNQYSARAKTLFITIAPAYLQRVKELYAADHNIEYTLLEYSDRDFKFRSNSGHLFEYGYDGLKLTFNRTPWYGEGKLLGKTYLLEMEYFDPKLIKLIEQSQASGPRR